MRRETATNHMRIKRTLAPQLEERDPSLINLPGVSLGGIPILGPLLTPLIGDGSTPAASTPAPAPTPTTPSGGGGGGSSGGGSSGGGSSGGGSSGGGSSGGDSGGDSGGGSSSGGSTSGGGSSGGSSGGGGSSGSSNSGGSGGSSSGSGSGTTGGGSGSSGTSSGGAANPAGSSPATGGSTAVGGVAGSSGTSGASTTAATGAVGNVGSSPPGGTNANSNSNPSAGLSSLGATSSAGSTGATGALGTAGVTGTGMTIAGTSLGTGGAQNPSATGSSGSAAGGSGVSKHGLSSGGIAAIVVVLVLGLIGLVVVLLRRRNVAKREERRDQWFAGYGSTGSLHSEGAVSSPSRARSAEATQGSGNASARSSFATTYDHGTGLRSNSPEAPPFNLSAISPEFPPMAEIRNNNGILHNNGNNGAKETSRFSTGSSGSGNSQYLFTPAASTSSPQGLHTPMSVRPFSPSESFSFPKPPSQAGERTGGLSPENENDWLTRSGPNSPNSPSGESGRTLTPKQFIAPVAAAAAVATTAATSGRMAHPYSGNQDNSSSGGSSYHSMPNPFADQPQRDAGATPSPEPGAAFETIELIRRPFAPTLDDELAVVPGDSVRVVKAFDDGWAYVEKIGTSAKGLIPIDCLRDAGQDLPAFMASKRISSYISERSVIGMGSAM